MSAPSSPPGDVFDKYADQYESALQRGLAVAGESSEFFARGRITWLAQCLRRLGESPQSVMDYGCGLGSSATLLLDVLGARQIIGLDVSQKALARARSQLTSERVRFAHIEEYEPRGEVDLVYSNGVFHHIAPAERGRIAEYILRCLRPGGIFALWENNPWNPGTRIVMSRIPFDRDAHMLSSVEAVRTLRQAGFEVLETSFLFVFPHGLRFLRWMEPHLARFPLGAQYQVLARKPGRT